MKKLLLILMLVVVILPGCASTDPAYVSANITNEPDVNVTNDPLNVNIAEVDSDAELKILGRTGDTTYQVPRIDATTHTLEIITAEHANIHKGISYSVADTVALDTATAYWMVETANTTTYAHFIFTLTATGEATFLVTEGADRDKGDILPAINRRRISPSTAGTIVSRTPTGGSTDGQIILFSMRNGITNVASKNVEGGEARAVNEWILAPGTKYIVSITNYVAGYVTCLLNWYEHEDRSP